MKKPQADNEADRRWARNLATAIILQAIEDIWLPSRKRESIEFFNGEQFIDCADIIGMSLYECQKVLEFVQAAYKTTLSLPKSKTSYFKLAYCFFPQHPGLQN